MNTICVPEVYSYFTDENPCAIIMEKIEGNRIENILSEDKHEYSKILSRFNLKCVFYDAIYHADLHSGNVIFMKEYHSFKDENNNMTTEPVLKIGIIDYGIIGTMTREEQNIFFTFFKILVSKDHKELSIFNALQYIFKTAKLDENINLLKLTKDEILQVFQTISQLIHITKTLKINSSFREFVSIFRVHI